MPVDPMIARPYIPDVSNTLGEIARLRVADNYRNSMLQQDQQALQFQQQKYSDEEAEDEKVAELLRSGQVDAAMSIDPETTQAFMQAKGIDPQSVFRNKQLEQTQSQFDTRMGMEREQFGARMGLDRQQFQAEQTHRQQQLELDRQRLAASGKAAATASNPMGYNERQLGGLGMQRDNAIMYAATLTGTSRQEVEQILATQGPEGVYKLMVEKGKRPLQGKAARWMQSFGLGKTFVEAENADLLAPAKAGGAGIALLQNPSGPITQADFQAGEAQFPNATYPLETQADMVRQMLTPKGGQAADDPLAVHAGKIIKQNGKRFQVVQGQDGKYTAVELK